MAKVTTEHPALRNGVSAGVQFKNGSANVTSDRLLAYFRRQSDRFTVQEPRGRGRRSPGPKQEGSGEPTQETPEAGEGATSAASEGDEGDAASEGADE